jgi:hypothetical protein
MTQITLLELSDFPMYMLTTHRALNTPLHTTSEIITNCCSPMALFIYLLRLQTHLPGNCTHSNKQLLKCRFRTIPRTVVQSALLPHTYPTLKTEILNGLATFPQQTPYHFTVNTHTGRIWMKRHPAPKTGNGQTPDMCGAELTRNRNTSLL